MTLDSIMTRNVVTVGPDESLERVRELFAANAFHQLLVTERGRLVGIITRCDLLKNLSPFIGKICERPQDTFLLKRRAHQIMSCRFATASPRIPARKAAAMMLDGGLHCLPVIDELGRVIGIVTGQDLLKHFATLSRLPADPTEAQASPVVASMQVAQVQYGK